jgi:hypothetical protein
VSIVVTPSGIVMAMREEHPSKARNAIFFTPIGMVMAVRDLHDMKAPWPIVVTTFGMVMSVREEQKQKAYSSISVTPSAKVTSVSSLFPLKSSSPEYTAELGISGRMEVVVLCQKGGDSRFAKKPNGPKSKNQSRKLICNLRWDDGLGSFLLKSAP